MPITHTIRVDAPRPTVWQHIEDPELQKAWMTGLLSNELIEGEKSQVGGKFKMVIKEGRKEQTYDGEITAHDEPNHLGVAFWGGHFKGVTRVTADYHLSEDNGGTRLDYVCDFEGEMGFLMKLMMPLFMCFGKMQLKKMLKKLKENAEGGGTTAAA
ncbi:SRPBCC family protein [Phycisphaeraceae bacterium D3-23]